MRLHRLCGERGIRTPEPVKVNGFQDRRIRPLCHLSRCYGPYPKGSANIHKFLFMQKKVSLTLLSKLEKSVKSVNLSIKNSGTNCVGEKTLTLFKLCQDFY